jgi:hypothetical protein
MQKFRSLSFVIVVLTAASVCLFVRSLIFAQQTGYNNSACVTSSPSNSPCNGFEATGGGCENIKQTTCANEDTPAEAIYCKGNGTFTADVCVAEQGGTCKPATGGETCGVKYSYPCVWLDGQCERAPGGAGTAVGGDNPTCTIPHCKK